MGLTSAGQKVNKNMNTYLTTPFTINLLSFRKHDKTLSLHQNFFE